MNIQLTPSLFLLTSLKPRSQNQKYKEWKKKSVSEKEFMKEGQVKQSVKKFCFGNAEAYHKCKR